VLIAAATGAELTIAIVIPYAWRDAAAPGDARVAEDGAGPGG
jgi:hypothetical protein